MSKELYQTSPQGTYYYLTKGDIAHGSKIVVLIHGMGLTALLFRDLINNLEQEQHIVLAYDLIGRGKSSFPVDHKFDADAHTNQLKSLLTHINAYDNKLSLHMICHSMGGALGSLFACKYPDIIESLTLLAPAGLMNPGPVRIIRNLPRCLQQYIRNRGLKPNQEKAWRQDFVGTSPEAMLIQNQTVETLRAINHDNPEVFEAAFQSILQFPLYGIEDTAKQLSSLSFNILLLWGNGDKTVPFNPNYTRWKAALESKRALSDGRDGNTCYQGIKTRVFDKLGHGFFVEDSSSVNNEILDFLRVK